MSRIAKPLSRGPLRGSLVAAVLLSLAGSQRAEATFHLWAINEVYSNADGSVQYIELFTNFNSQQFTINTTINAEDNGSVINSFVFPSNTPSPTAGHHLLLATPGFADLPGAVTPDFILPAAPFFNPDSSLTTIEYVFATSISFSDAQLPTDGVLSLNPDFSTATNSPTNYAGETGELAGAEPLAGDLDGDGFVGIADLNLVLGNWNQSVGAGDPLQGDPSGDGFVGIEDLNTVLGNWNAGTPPGNGNVPEPGSLTVLGLLSCVWLRQR